MHKADISPLLMTMQGQLRFTARGQWLHDQVLVTHPGITRYFSQHLRYDDNLQAYIIEVDGKCVKVEIEDVPFVVKTIDTSKTPWCLLINDETTEDFKVEQLRYNSHAELYYLLNRNETAKLMAPAIQALTGLISSVDQEYFIGYQNTKYRIMPLAHAIRKP